MAAMVENRVSDQKRGVVGRMSIRTAAWLAWSVCALSLTLTALALLLLALNLSHPNTHTFYSWLDNTLTAISMRQSVR